VDRSRLVAATKRTSMRSARVAPAGPRKRPRRVRARCAARDPAGARPRALRPAAAPPPACAAKPGWSRRP
jgi:hypothetical protein